MFLLDTNVVSEIRKIAAGRADPALVQWAHDLDGTAAFVSVITLHELEHGVLLAERRDPKGAAPLRHWLDNDVREAFADRVLSVDQAVAKLAASLHVPDPACLGTQFDDGHPQLGRLPAVLRARSHQPLGRMSFPL